MVRRFLLLLLMLAPAAHAQTYGLAAKTAVQDMGRGVNIVGYDPIWQDPAKARFQIKHFAIIKDGGFDNVRINLYGFRQMDEKGRLPAKWFATLDTLVNGALAENLYPILDMHDYEFCGKDAAGCRTRLLAFWAQVAEHFKDHPPAVTFEILNEPNRAMDPEWNKVHAEVLALIRKTNPKRNVLIGPAYWNNYGWLDKLELPKEDRHIIVSVHYYEPHRFTHQGARWTPEYVKLSGITWGSAADRAKLEADFDHIAAWAKKHDRPIYIGEFGAYDKAPLESRVAYTSAVARAAEKRGFAFGYWQFDSNFVVYDIDKDRWNEPIHRALVPKK